MHESQMVLELRLNVEVIVRCSFKPDKLIVAVKSAILFQPYHCEKDSLELKTLKISGLNF